MDLDGIAYRESAKSRSPIEVVDLPISNDLNVLRAMSSECHNLNHKVINYYGRIPSLLYAEKHSGDYSPRTRFSRYNWMSQVHDIEEFYDLIEELLDGNPIHPSIRIFDKLSSLTKDKLLRWPPCYVSCILKLFSAMIPGKEALISAFKSFETNQEAIDAGRKLSQSHL